MNECSIRQFFRAHDKMSDQTILRGGADNVRSDTPFIHLILVTKPHSLCLMVVKLTIYCSNFNYFLFLN